ncbi:MAG TPA: Fe-S cluster assembly protein IscX [Terriglobales bacterium]|jgi:FeS assembly protein IscX|nr:Fe-S cluster assembly protein IscX [Terriglobales bacterium]
MGDKLTWDDVEKIGVLLSRKHPELYPLSTDLAELHRRVTNLPGFQDNANTFDKTKLEAIQAAWNNEFLDRTQ